MAVSFSAPFRSRVVAVAMGVTMFAAVAVSCGDSAAPEFLGVPDGAAIVDQDGLRFRPGDLNVSSGDDVYFTNSEHAIHTVTIDGENISGTMARGDVVVWTFDTPGEYRVTCDFHPKMKATIIVE